MERMLREERQRLEAEAAGARAWYESPFTPTSVEVGTPMGEFARFIAEVAPLVPRRMWRKALVGRSPDGHTRVAWSLPRDEDGDDGPGSAVLRHRGQHAAKCKLFMVYKYTALNGGGVRPVESFRPLSASRPSAEAAYLGSFGTGTGCVRSR
jgi:hypothetical protein